MKRVRHLVGNVHVGSVTEHLVSLSPHSPGVFLSLAENFVLGRNHTHASPSVCLPAVGLFFHFTVCRLGDSVHTLFPFTLKWLMVEFSQRHSVMLRLQETTAVCDLLL